MKSFGKTVPPRSVPAVCTISHTLVTVGISRTAPVSVGAKAVFGCLQDIRPRQSPVGVAAGQDRLQVHFQQEVHRGGLSNLAPA